MLGAFIAWIRFATCSASAGAQQLPTQVYAPTVLDYCSRFIASLGCVACCPCRCIFVAFYLATRGFAPPPSLFSALCPPPSPRAPNFVSQPCIPFPGKTGMNLHSGIETDGVLFRVVAMATACACTIGFCGLFTFFYRQGILVS